MDIERLPEFAVHVTAGGAWETIRQHGLLCTRAAIEGASENGQPVDVEQFVRTRRPVARRLNHPLRGEFVVNHNQPIQETVLARLLTNGRTAGDSDATEPQYYRALHDRAFFWPARSHRHIASFQSAFGRRRTGYVGGTTVDRITIDLRALAASAGTKMGLSRYNSGSTPRYSRDVERYALSRSPHMWVPVGEWTLRPSQIKEIAVAGSIVPESMNELVIRVERGNELLGFTTLS